VKELAQDVAKDWSMKVFIVVPPPRAALGRHVKDGHVKDAAQDAAQDVAQAVAGGNFGAAEDGSVKVLVLCIVIFQRRNPRPTHALRPKRLLLGDT